MPSRVYFSVKLIRCLVKFGSAAPEGPRGCVRWMGNYDADGWPIVYSHGAKPHRIRIVVLRLKEGRRLLPYETAVSSCNNSWCVNPAHLSVLLVESQRIRWQIAQTERENARIANPDS